MPAHIVFGKSAAVALRRALLRRKSSEVLICLDDNYSIGPIGCDLEYRESWLSGIYGYSFAAALSDDDALWQTALMCSDLRVWFSSNSARELCGVSEFYRRQRLNPTSKSLTFSDVAESESASSVGMVQKTTNMSFAMLNDEQLEQLMSKHQETFLGCDELAARWGKLKAANSVLRIVKDRKIQSVPLTFFDPLLIEACQSKWMPINRVVADVLYATGANGNSQTSFDFLIARINAIISSSAVEFRTNADVLEIKQTPSNH